MCVNQFHRQNYIFHFITLFVLRIFLTGYVNVTRHHRTVINKPPTSCSRDNANDPDIKYCAEMHAFGPISRWNVYTSSYNEKKNYSFLRSMNTKHCHSFCHSMWMLWLTINDTSCECRNICNFVSMHCESWTHIKYNMFCEQQKKPEILCVWMWRDRRWRIFQQK